MTVTKARYWEKAQRGGASASAAVVACEGSRAEATKKPKRLKIRNIAGDETVVNID